MLEMAMLKYCKLVIKKKPDLSDPNGPLSSIVPFLQQYIFGSL